MTKGIVAWAHIRTHPREARFIERNHVLLIQDRACKVTGTKTVLAKRDGRIQRRISVVDVLSGKKKTLLEEAGTVLKECKVLKEEFKVYEPNGQCRTVYAMPIVELRERRRQHEFDPNILDRATKKHKRNLSAGSVDSNANDSDEENIFTGKSLVNTFPRVEYKSGDAGKQQILYKPKHWQPFEQNPWG